MKSTRSYTKKRQAVWRRLFDAWEKKKWPLDGRSKKVPLDFERIWNYSFFRNFAYASNGASRRKRTRAARLPHSSSKKVVSDDDFEEDEGESEVDELDEDGDDDTDNRTPQESDYDDDDMVLDDPPVTQSQDASPITPSVASSPSPLPGPSTRIFRVSDANLLFITIELPGFRASDIAVSFHKGDLVVVAPAGANSQNMGQNHDETDWIYQEGSREPIYKRVSLPYGIDPNEIKASLEHGILIVQSPLENDYHLPILVSEPSFRRRLNVQ
ncbi:hypothetical protein ONZ45_g15767 [Pleurotus djamor]|nr:hypothetical protein ONZ45_g15767 [Pleurotus djamor]